MAIIEEVLKKLTRKHYLSADDLNYIERLVAEVVFAAMAQDSSGNPTDTAKVIWSEAERILRNEKKSLDKH